MLRDDQAQADALGVVLGLLRPDRSEELEQLRLVLVSYTVATVNNLDK